jgi:hypothetical protein
MKRKLRLFGVIAGIYLLLFWTILGILYFSGFQLFGFIMPPHNPPVLDFLFSLFGVLSFPLGLLPSTGQSPFWVGFTMIALLLLNSCIWGVSLGSLFYAARRLIRRHAA